jgi:NAD(P)H-hydrate epimerase
VRAVSAAQMRAIDAAAVARDGEIALMRRAGEAIAALVPHYALPGPVVALAGPGNNGGDAFAALAELRGGARIAYHDPAAAGSPARRDALERARAAGVDLRPHPADPGVLVSAGIILDGVLGVNARLPLADGIEAHVAAILTAGRPVLALDIATGCDPDSGALAPVHVRATATIALGAPKRGSLLEPGRGAAGELWCAPLGMRDADAGGLGDDVDVLDDDAFAALLPARAGDSDKRRSGAPLIVAGSVQFPGAAVLCARGAARAGAGYVTLAVPEAVAATVRAHLVEQVVVTYDDRDAAGAAASLLDLANHASAIGIGPGLGLGDAMGDIVRTLVARSPLPLCIDASALFHLAKHVARLAGKRSVVTPHAGEFARLSGGGTLAPGDAFPRARDFAAAHDTVLLLKGRTTIVADRTRTALNPTGTAALATAGTGDVLTGIITTLLAQGLDPFDAARAGAYWHGRAGQLAGEARAIGVMAGDLPDLLAAAAQPRAGLPRPVGTLVRRIF